MSLVLHQVASYSMGVCCLLGGQCPLTMWLWCQHRVLESFSRTLMYKEHMEKVRSPLRYAKREAFCFVFFKAAWRQWASYLIFSSYWNGILDGLVSKSFNVEQLAGCWSKVSTQSYIIIDTFSNADIKTIKCVFSSQEALVRAERWTWLIVFNKLGLLKVITRWQMWLVSLFQKTEIMRL